MRRNRIDSSAWLHRLTMITETTHKKRNTTMCCCLLAKYSNKLYIFIFKWSSYENEHFYFPTACARVDSFLYFRPFSLSLSRSLPLWFTHKLFLSGKLSTTRSRSVYFAAAAAVVVVVVEMSIECVLLFATLLMLKSQFYGFISPQ